MNQELPNFRDVRAIRTIGAAYDERLGADDEVNEALRLGWVLLLVQTGDPRPLYVVGWTGEGEAPMTDREKSSAARLEAARKHEITG
jgi:hypothetical protein